MATKKTAKVEPEVRDEYMEKLSKQLAGWGRWEALVEIAANRSLPVSTRLVAVDYLRKSNDSEALYLAYKIWIKKRSPELGEYIKEKPWQPQSTTKSKIFTLLLHDNINLAPTIDLEDIHYLLKIRFDKKETEFAPRAEKALRELKEEWLESVAIVWVETKEPLLLEILATREYVPWDNQRKAWLAIYLPSRAPFLTQWSIPDEIPPVLETLKNADKDLQARAREILQNLTHQAAQEEVCRQLILDDHPYAQQVALEKGWMPEDLAARALFLFVAEVWDKYDLIDFDRRLMRLNYQAADNNLRRRIAEKVRKSGRSEYLEIFTGGETLSREKELTDQEAAILVKILGNNQNWQKLWELVGTLPLKHSREAILKLSEVGWQPQSEDARAVFAELVALAQVAMYVEEQEARQNWPVVAERLYAHVKISEKKVNPEKLKDIAFAHTQSLLALVVSNNRVVFYNLQSATIEKVIKLPKVKTVSLAAFSKNDILCLAERTSIYNGVCSVYRWWNNELQKLGEHSGSVTSLLAVGQDLMLSTSSRGEVFLWNMTTGEKVAEFAVESSHSRFIRSVCFAPDEKTVALISDEITFVDVPYFNNEIIDTISIGEYESPQKACSTPDGRGLYLFKKEAFARYIEIPVGRVWQSETAIPKDLPAYGIGVRNRADGRKVRLLSISATPNKNLPVAGKSYVLGGVVSSSAGVMVSVVDSGKLSVTDWPDQNVICEIETVKSKYKPPYSEILVNGLKLSPDGYYVAVSNTQGDFFIYDLRFLVLRKLFSRPIADLGVKDLLLIKQMREDYPSVLTSEVLNALKYIETTVSRLRLRFAIEIDDITMVRAGEFDIEVAD